MDTVGIGVLTMIGLFISGVVIWFVIWYRKEIFFISCAVICWLTICFVVGSIVKLILGIK
jgi:hypothetical protein